MLVVGKGLLTLLVIDDSAAFAAASGGTSSAPAGARQRLFEVRQHERHGGTLSAARPACPPSCVDGYTSAELLGAHLWDRVHPDDEVRLRQRFEACAPLNGGRRDVTSHNAAQA